MKKFWLFAIVACVFAFAVGCDKGKSTSAPATTSNDPAVARFLLSEEPDKYDVPININFENKIKILGVNYNPKPLMHGKKYTMTFYYKVLGEMSEDYEFFGHFEPEDGQRFRGKMDHLPLNGAFPTSKWKKGMILKDTFRETMPAAFPSKAGVLWGGFYRGDKRLAVVKADRSKADKNNRGKLAVMKLDDPGAVDPPKKMTVYKTKSKITIDGKLNEKGWAKATSTGYFTNVAGDTKVKPYTTAKMIWDSDYLYIGFSCDDPDVWTSYTKKDDPLYKEETVEIMIDADGSASTYYELQVNAANVVYDAYFPERRKNMDIKWDSKIKSAVSIDGTHNKRSDVDKKWNVEIAVPISNLADAKPVKEGTSWRINFYRMEKPKKRGTIASMWSPTLVGDFHQLKRFGTINFTEKYAEDRKVLQTTKLKKPRKTDPLSLKEKY